MMGFEKYPPPPTYKWDTGQKRLLMTETQPLNPCVIVFFVILIFILMLFL